MLTSSVPRLPPLQSVPQTRLSRSPSHSRLSQEGDFRESPVGRETATASVASWLAITSPEVSPVHGARRVLGDVRSDHLDRGQGEAVLGTDAADHTGSDDTTGTAGIRANASEGAERPEQHSES